jgi:hypothetical protein
MPEDRDGVVDARSYGDVLRALSADAESKRP